MKYLIDTNICIYIINNHPPEVFEKFKKVKAGDIGISAITVSELYFGAYNSTKVRQNIQRIEEFLDPFRVLPFHDDAAREYGKIRASLQRSGKIIGPLDMLIAAHAISENLIVITNNTKEFSRIQSLDVENWAHQE